MIKWRYVFILFIFAIWAALTYGTYDTLLARGEIAEWQFVILLSLMWLVFAGIVYVAMKLSS